jgi:hypothetical protein
MATLESKKMNQNEFNAFFEDWKAGVSNANKDGPGEDRKETDNDAPEIPEKESGADLGEAGSDERFPTDDKRMVDREENKKDNEFIEKMTDYVLAKIGVINADFKVDTTPILNNVSTGKIELQKDEALLKHIIYDACNHHDEHEIAAEQFYQENNSFDLHVHTFRDDIKQSIYDTYQIARKPLMNVYQKYVEPEPENTFLNKSIPVITKNENVDDYTNSFNKNLVEQMKNNNAEWQNPTQHPYFTQDAFTKHIYHDANQVGLLLNNSRLGYPYINYAPVNIIIDSKKNWLKELKKQEKESPWCNTIYKGKDEKGNKRYEMVVPTKKLNQNVMVDNPAFQAPLPQIGLNQNYAPNPQNIEQLLTTQIANYLNAAFTKIPYYTQNWTPEQLNQLSSSIQQDPFLGLRASQNAFSQSISHQIPLEKQQELNSFSQKYDNDINFKDNFLSTMATMYSSPKSQLDPNRPQFMQYMDNVANQTLSPTTPTNVIQRLDALMQNPAIRNDMITTYSSHVNNNTNSNASAQTEKAGRGR